MAPAQLTQINVVLLVTNRLCVKVKADADNVTLSIQRTIGSLGAVILLACTADIAPATTSSTDAAGSRFACTRIL